MIYVRGGRAVRVRHGRRCAPIMINAPPSPHSFSHLHSSCFCILLKTRRPSPAAMLLISPYSTSHSLSPYASLSFFLLTEGAFGLQAAVGYDRFAAPQLCSCRTGRSLFKLDVRTLSLPALSALSDRRWRVRGMDRERDGQSKRATDESKWKDGRGPGDRRQKEKWSCSE